MTTLLGVLILIAVVAVGGGLTLRRLSRTRLPADLGPAEILSAGRSVGEIYQPMSRLFAEEDFAFLSNAPPGLRKRLRQERRQTLRLYLRQLRGDFERVYAFCRLLARDCTDPNFAPLITQQAMSFYGLLFVMQMRCSMGWFLHVRVDAVDLVGSLDRLWQAAQAAASSMVPQQALAASLA